MHKIIPYSFKKRKKIILCGESNYIRTESIKHLLENIKKEN